MKQRPCCARAKARVGGEKANLARLARLAALRPEQKRYVDLIKAAKESLEAQRQNLIDHEASHAGEVAA